jgi:hypothetical protein
VCVASLLPARLVPQGRAQDEEEEEEEVQKPAARGLFSFGARKVCVLLCVDAWLCCVRWHNMLPARACACVCLLAVPLRRTSCSA